MEKDTQKEMTFFEKFDEASWEFTYGSKKNMDKTIVQVGLTALFYIDECWKPEKREALANAVERFIDEFGDKLKWGFIDDINKPEKFVKGDKLSRMKRLADLEDDSADLLWSSEFYLDFVGDYQINAFSPAGWYEHVHRRVSYICFFLPTKELNEEKNTFEKLVLDFCTLLQPIHGVAGLGTQQLYDDNMYQFIECDIARHFNGVDVTAHVTDRGLRDGIRSINWYTILSDEWVNKIGGGTYLKQQFMNDDIHLLPYQGGIVIKAGEWPELGWVERDPYPKLYVKVNHVLKPIRTPSFKSFHLGSISGEIRLDERLTKEWQERLDAEGEKLELKE
ncbi:DUF3396 domain-containing protein [Providencia rettgeri]|uniref:type VI immunity family protein n=1 Tax=Providencia TaxID=586 RepID=UPI001CFE3E8B|nr:type VI immunity family protein [Providencia rettgeri]EIU7556869.1 DUF3396 domain-containing protein [Providencia rettgeri]MCB4839232.1 DUF3396 domain-containing protein [Providencia rettgeri]HEM8305106.1 DUF3396 domain-containing protein [Providencia rettgeri]